MQAEFSGFSFMMQTFKNTENHAILRGQKQANRKKNNF